MPYIDHEEYPDFEQDDEGVTCNRCGEAGCYWQPITQPDGRSEKPVLFDSATDKAHVCAPSADDFEVVP